MPEDGDGDTQTTLEGSQAPELDAKQIEQLTDLVYKLIKDDLIVTRERRGDTSARGWR